MKFPQSSTKYAARLNKKSPREVKNNDFNNIY